MILDEDEIVNEKMNKNEARYPVDKARGKASYFVFVRHFSFRNFLMVVASLVS